MVELIVCNLCLSLSNGVFPTSYTKDCGVETGNKARFP